MTMYQLSICYPADGRPPTPAELDLIMVEMNKVGAAMTEQGVWVFSGGLQDPSAATTVMDQAGVLVLTDGPFIESKERIGGITVIDVADLDEAINWAQQQSAAAGVPVEVRPFMYGNARY
ncbi:MAG: YciI family protein [Actinomycetota bacterium]|nr:YciI family protein [Actinomycetota bacterium]